MTSQIHDGQIIEACLYLLDKNPDPHPVFGCPAISINRAAEQLLSHESALSSRQVAQAIAPLAETLFPSPRVPNPKVHQGERWIVFDSPATKATPAQKRQHRRNTIIGRPSPDTNVPAVPLLPAPPARKDPRPLQLAPTRARPRHPPLPSAPLRQSSSGELIEGLDTPLPNGVDGRVQPKSVSHGKRSFLRPFLLRSKKKPTTDTVSYPPVSTPMTINPHAGDEPDSAWTHVPERALSTEFEMVDTPADPSAIVDDYMQDTASVVDSPYEETAFISGSPPNVVPPPHPLRQATVSLRPKTRTPPTRIAEGNEIRVEQDLPAPKGDKSRPSETRSGETPLASPASPAAQDTKAGHEARAQRPVTPEKPERSRHDEKRRHREERRSRPSSGERRDRDHRDRDRDRERERESKERDDHHDKPRSHRSEVDDRGSRRVRRSENERRSRRVQKSETTWLEGVFDGLPFGPNHTTVKVKESVMKDWRLFFAELVALVGLAYVVQASGW